MSKYETFDPPKRPSLVARLAKRVGNFFKGVERQMVGSRQTATPRLDQGHSNAIDNHISDNNISIFDIEKAALLLSVRKLNEEFLKESGFKKRSENVRTNDGFRKASREEFEEEWESKRGERCDPKWDVYENGKLRDVQKLAKRYGDAMDGFGDTQCPYARNPIPFRDYINDPLAEMDVGHFINEAKIITQKQGTYEAKQAQHYLYAFVLDEIKKEFVHSYEFGNKDGVSKRPYCMEENLSDAISKIHSKFLTKANDERRSGKDIKAEHIEVVRQSFKEFHKMFDKQFNEIKGSVDTLRQKAKLPPLKVEKNRQRPYEVAHCGAGWILYKRQPVSKPFRGFEKLYAENLKKAQSALYYPPTTRSKTHRSGTGHSGRG